jgi:hypothetical protein
MDGLNYNPAGYRNMVKMSSFKHILVEGKDDKRSMKYLIQDLWGKRSDILVHGAHQIQFGINIGNRERVEEICRNINGKKYAKRFVGFVDREFREFDLANEIRDLINKHNILDRLIWSRGHSIENYYFDFIVLSKPLRDYSLTQYFDDALDLFEQSFEQVIKLACALSLASWQCNLLKPAKRCMDWSILEFNGLELTINTTIWLNSLISKQKVRYEEASVLIDTFQLWLEKVSKTHFNTVRWLCHGHIGIAFIWAAYARCVFEVCHKSGCEDPRREANHVLKADETVRFNGCASEWAKQAPHRSCEYPTDVFAHLGLLEH